MSTENSVDVVHAFWDEVWNGHDPAAADRFVVGDFVIVSGGETISGRENFKKWIEGFIAKLTDLHLEVIESFQNADGTRVTSRWLLTGQEQRHPRHETRSTGRRHDRHRGVGRPRGRQAADELG